MRNCLEHPLSDGGDPPSAAVAFTIAQFHHCNHLFHHPRTDSQVGGRWALCFWLLSRVGDLFVPVKVHCMLLRARPDSCPNPILISHEVNVVSSVNLLHSERKSYCVFGSKDK